MSSDAVYAPAQPVKSKYGQENPAPSPLRLVDTSSQSFRCAAGPLGNAVRGSSCKEEQNYVCVNIAIGRCKETKPRITRRSQAALNEGGHKYFVCPDCPPSERRSYTRMDGLKRHQLLDHRLDDNYCRESQL